MENREIAVVISKKIDYSNVFLYNNTYQRRIFMKKLNNKGWGLFEMLFLSCCILIALLIATYFIYILYNSF